MLNLVIVYWFINWLFIRIDLFFGRSSIIPIDHALAIATLLKRAFGGFCSLERFTWPGAIRGARSGVYLRGGITPSSSSSVAIPSTADSA
jgi:hypothetical protein